MMETHKRFRILWLRERKGEMTVKSRKYKCLKWSLLFHTNACAGKMYVATAAPTPFMSKESLGTTNDLSG